MAKSKNEIDKEIMYRKIMPTTAKPLHKTEDTAEASFEQTQAAKPVTAAASIFGYSSAANRMIHESRDMVLVNVMEDLVVEKLDMTLSRFNCCKCNKCKKDIAAVALNRLPPRYMVMKENDQEKRKNEEEKYSSEVTGAIIQAILVVKKNPRH